MKNQQPVEAGQIEQVRDLDLTREQAAQSKAGTSNSAGGGHGAGKVQMQDFHF
jgi:hypothetical protein